MIEIRPAKPDELLRQKELWKLAFGDEVVNINGKNLADVAQSQLEVDAILDAIQEDTAYIIVLKEGKEKKVEIKRF